MKAEMDELRDQAASCCEAGGLMMEVLFDAWWRLS
jgi:hypothetical protein